MSSNQKVARESGRYKTPDKNPTMMCQLRPEARLKTPPPRYLDTKMTGNFNREIDHFEGGFTETPRSHQDAMRSRIDTFGTPLPGSKQNTEACELDLAEEHKLLEAFEPISSDLKEFPEDLHLKRALWVPNDYSEFCMRCNGRFCFLLIRRHHCRICGLLFCGKCSKYKERVNGKNQRVCKDCKMKAIGTRNTPN